MTPEWMRLPSFSPPAARPGIPLVAMLAPLGVALVLWLVTASAVTMLFALLGPVVALAAWFDARRTAHRDRRRGLVTLARELDELEARWAAEAEARRREFELEAPPLVEVLADFPAVAEADPVWRLGTGDRASGWRLDGDELDAVPELAARVAALRERIGGIPDAPIVARTGEEFHLEGPDALARASARGLVLQGLARSPVSASRLVVPASERWASRLPHRVEYADRWELEVDGRVLIRVHLHEPTEHLDGLLRIRVGASGAEIDGGLRHPALVCTAEAAYHAERLARASARAAAASAGGLPATVTWRELAVASVADASTLAAPVGRDAAGVVMLDLDAQGPHALVAGTTGSGKSELLVSWILALALTSPPSRLQLLLLDFKGGAAFAPLRRLPQVVGVLSDLDQAMARRAVESLRAELRRREAILAASAARSIGELPPGMLSRLVIVVDEFAALLGLDAGLDATFADLAARGRSLGLHLVLCTQRPAGVIRDATLANITLRICLRVIDSADSTSVVGAPDAAAIPASARGRAMLADGERVRAVQFAIAAPEDVEFVRERWAAEPHPEHRPWLDPLPERILVSELPAPSRPGFAVIGLVDLPEEQRRGGLELDPDAGAVLVIGGAGSGRTTALAALAHSCGRQCRWVDEGPAQLWAALTEPPPARPVLVAIDDLDRILGAADPEQRADLGELLARTARDARRSGVVLAATAGTSSGVMAPVAGVFEQRVLLRLSSREEQFLAGGVDLRPGARTPGRASWGAHEAQLAIPPAGPPSGWQPEVPRARLAEGSWALVVPRPAEWIPRLRSAGIRSVSLEASSSEPAATVVVADPDAWLADYAALSAARREGPLLLVGCTSGDHRALTRLRGPLPPLDGDGEGWRVEGTATTRVSVRLD